MSRSELNNELVLAFQYVDDRYLDIVEQETAPEDKEIFLEADQTYGGVYYRFDFNFGTADFGDCGRLFWAQGFAIACKA